MSKDPRIQGYATALFQVARAEGALQEVEEELFRFAQLVREDSRLRDAITDLNLPPEHRGNMLGELLGGKASGHTVNILKFVVEQGRARDLPAIVDSLIELAAAERQHAVAEVRSAIPLDADARERLRDAVKQATGKDVEIRVIVDASVIGGLHVRVGDVVFDGTVRHRLQQMKDLVGRS